MTNRDGASAAYALAPALFVILWSSGFIGAAAEHSALEDAACPPA